MRKVSAVSMVIVVMSLVSCLSAMNAVNRQEAPKGEINTKTFLMLYPKYRIDDRVKKLAIIGIGDGKTDITSLLNQYLTKFTDTKVVEEGNLQSIIGGRILEYGTGLSASESQALGPFLFH